MGSRSNLYKNPSISYKKDLSLSSVLQNLHAYNLATGNPPSTDEVKPQNDVINRSVKRRRVKNPPREIEFDDGPMSHQDYVDKRRHFLSPTAVFISFCILSSFSCINVVVLLLLNRKEVNVAQPYERLSEDILGSSSSVLNLVGYESDESATSEPEEKEVPSSSGHTDASGLVSSRSEQRFPVPGEPVCVMCGKYGEYICDVTEDDICSLECKADLLQSLRRPEHTKTKQSQDINSRGLKSIQLMPEIGTDTWDYNRHRWSKKISNLCTYECWKCQKPGHLADDCLTNSSNQVEGGKNKTNAMPRDLLVLYRRCHELGRNLSAAHCSTCRSSLSLATCVDCSTVICDNAGHVHEHLKRNPSHQQYYSHKLKRLVKCCKSTCKVTKIKDLLACHYCFDKAFDKFYDMYTATWNGAGLSIIAGSICCEDHFEWHRMNCLNAGVEDNALIIGKKEKLVQVSDYIF